MASLDSIEVGDKKNREILDLSQINISSKNELDKLLERVPDFKVRSERVRTEDVQESVECCSTVENVATKPVITKSIADYPFSNPIPSSLREVCLKELGRVNISWRMLTLARPKTKLEEDFFSRLVQLEKLQYKTVQWEMDKVAIKDKKSNESSSHSTSGNRSTGRGGNRGSSVAEKRMQTCKECGVEFCAGKCKNFLYDDFARTFNPITNDIFEVVKKSTSSFKKGPANEKLKKSKNSKAVVSEEPNAPSGSQSEQPKAAQVPSLKPANTKKRIAKRKSKKTKSVNDVKQ